MTCPLLVTTVKLWASAVVDNGGRARSQEQAGNAKKWWGLWPWAERRARSHVRRLGLCRPRNDGQKSAEHSRSALAPEAPAPRRLGLGACA